MSSADDADAELVQLLSSPPRTELLSSGRPRPGSSGTRSRRGGSAPRRAPSSSGRSRTRSRRAAARPSRARRAGSRTSRAAPRREICSRSNTRACRLRPRGSGTSRRRARCRCRSGRRRTASACFGSCVEALLPLGRRARERVVLRAPSAARPRPTRTSGSRSPRATTTPRSSISPSCSAEVECAARRARAWSAPSCRRRRAAVVPGSPAKRGELRLGEELRDRRAHLARLVGDHVGEPLRAPLLRELLERVELGARERLRRADEADRLGAREDAELRAARRLGRVLELEPEAQVGLVGAEAAVGLRPRSCAGTASRARRRCTRARPSGPSAPSARR